MPQIRTDVLPPSGGKPRVRIVRPDQGQSITAVILSDRLYGVMTHWDKSRKRTFPHYDPADECPHCLTNMPFGHWRGYLAAFRPAQRRYVLVELTEHAAGTADLVGPPPEWLRGSRITLTRGATKPNDPVQARLERQTAVAWLPPEFNVLEALERIWAGEAGKASEVYDRLGDGPGPVRVEEVEPTGQLDPPPWTDQEEIPTE